MSPNDATVAETVETLLEDNDSEEAKAVMVVAQKIDEMAERLSLYEDALKELGGTVRQETQ